MASYVFLSKQYQRHALNAATLQALEKRVEERTAQQERRCATPKEFWEGFWDFNLAFVSLAFVDVNKKYYFHPVRKPSVLRESFYEFMAVLLVSLPFFIALGIRISAVPHFSPDNGCTGCIVQWPDVLIVCLILVTLMLPTICLIYKVQKFNIPDPLMSIIDTLRG